MVNALTGSVNAIRDTQVMDVSKKWLCHNLVGINVKILAYSQVHKNVQYRSHLYPEVVVILKMIKIVIIMRRKRNLQVRNATKNVYGAASVDVLLNCLQLLHALKPNIGMQLPQN
jgi:hypothetical protein